MDSAVITQFLGQLVPLGSAPQAVDDAIEHLSGVGSFATGSFGRVHLKYDGFYHFPQLVRHLPDRVQSFLLLHISYPRAVFGESLYPFQASFNVLR
jgi:hypothetical protein